jgi:hypothetical protein
MTEKIAMQTRCIYCPIHGHKEPEKDCSMPGEKGTEIKCTCDYGATGGGLTKRNLTCPIHSCKCVEKEIGMHEFIDKSDCPIHGKQEVSQKCPLCGDNWHRGECKPKPSPQKIDTLVFATRYDMDKLVCEKLNQLITAFNKHMEG